MNMAVLVDAVDRSLPPRKRFRFCHSQPDHMATPLDAGVMLNGYGQVDPHKNHSPDDSSANSEGVPPVATLCNLGNTCFLNSVLYTLRFAPSLLHNLHHLATDLDTSGRYYQIKCKSSSLGRGISGASKAWAGKECSSLPEENIALATLRLHELYMDLHNAELKEQVEPYQPEVFLAALRDVNSIFEGNQQHDAHELLVCLLDNIRETCQQLIDVQSCIIPLAPPCPPPPTKTPFSTVRKSLKLGKTKNNGLNDKKTASDGGLILNDSNSMTNEDEAPRVSRNFISDDFQGVTQLRTTCMECEQVTERRETFCDICVPIPSIINPEESESSLYHSAVVTEELLVESNKYWCERCLRYNEARRCVRYEILPRLLILQLKRFKTSTVGYGVSKVNDYMPTPLTLSCFCIKCKDIEESKKSHRGYELYGVITHLGATMASGHYITYVCSRDTTTDCASCTRDKRKSASLSDKHSGGLLRFFKSSKSSTYPSNLPGPYLSACRSGDCCGVRMEPPHEPLWLECDDDTIRTLSRSQLEDILTLKSPNSSTLTPYLLFYSRLP